MSRAEYQRRWRASKGARTGAHGPPASAPHGTVSAYKRHRRRLEPVCEACRAAWNQFQREYSARRRQTS